MEKIIQLKEPVGTITHADKLFKKIKKINIDYNQENFLVFFLNTRRKIIKTEILFKGGVNSCLIDPKTLFRKALLRNSSAIIVAHNHPSGELSPSMEDKEIFAQLQKGGEILSIQILDSIIFNKKKYYSMND